MSGCAFPNQLGKWGKYAVYRQYDINLSDVIMKRFMRNNKVYSNIVARQAISRHLRQGEILKYVEKFGIFKM